MTFLNSEIIGFFWLIYIMYWAIAARGVKRNLKRVPWWQGIGFRVAIIAVAFFLLSMPASRQGLRTIAHAAISQNPIIGIFGVILCGLGIVLAVWARVHIGINWGQPMSIKEKPDLVSTGPYAYIRHPIYAGIIIAMFGSALASSLLWLIPLCIVCFYFLYSANTEEKNMTKEFPKEYPAYMKRTKRLIPFVY